MEKRHQALKLAISAVVVLLALLLLGGFLGNGEVVYQLPENRSIGTAVPQSFPGVCAGAVPAEETVLGFCCAAGRPA